MAMQRAALLLSLLPAWLVTTGSAQADAGPRVSGDIRLAREISVTSDTGAWAQAHARWPTLYPAVPSRWSAQAQLQADARRHLDDGATLGLHADGQVATQRDDGDAHLTPSGRVNELYGRLDLTDWQLSAGRRIVAWDVGYAFRPNDVVQREARRPLLPTTPQGRGVVQVEHFGADSATSLVAVEPQRGTDEAGAALRHFQRFGTLDAYLHADWQRDSRTSLGAAFAWVASDAIALHGSTRWQPHRSRHQTLAGLSWTGGPDVTLLAEVWHDGAAQPAAARRNVYLRASTPQDAWTWSLDALLQPEDRGRVLGAGLRWQGDRWRVDAAWRLHGGPRDAALRQGPLRQSGAVAVTRAF
jgi:hypothetical protein